MSKYNVKFSCGHEETVGLIGPYKDRERKIAYYEKAGLCSECRKKAMIAKMESDGNIIEVKYSEYKNKYSHCKTVPDSYNAETKTIRVVIDTKVEEARMKEAAIEEVRNDLIKAIPALVANKKLFGRIHEDGSKYYTSIDGERYYLSDKEKHELEVFLERREIAARVVKAIHTMSYEDLKAKKYLELYDFSNTPVVDIVVETTTVVDDEEEKKELQAAAQQEVVDDLLASKPWFLKDKYWNKKIYTYRLESYIFLDSKRRDLDEDELYQVECYLENIRIKNEVKSKIATMTVSELREKKYKELYDFTTSIACKKDKFAVIDDLKEDDD